MAHGKVFTAKADLEYGIHMMDECRCWGHGSLQQQVMQQAQKESNDSTIQQISLLGRGLSRAAEAWSQQGLEKHACDKTLGIKRQSVRSEQQQSYPAESQTN